jgi:hypothetical protein
LWKAIAVLAGRAKLHDVRALRNESFDACRGELKPKIKVEDPTT